MRHALVLSACLTAAACATMPPPAATPPLEFVVVRHAEKAVEAGDDPPLVASGRARAEAIAASLARAPVVAVYSTAYARTRATAAPTAAAHGLPVTAYDAREPAQAFAATLRARHDSGTVLVVGHSNTVPAIASALCACEVASMEESEYDRLLRVHVAPAGPRLAVERQGPVPAP